MSVLPTMEAVLRHVQTLLDHLSVIAKVDTLLLAMDSHAMVCTDYATIQLTLLLECLWCLCFFQLRSKRMHQWQWRM